MGTHTGSDQAPSALGIRLESQKEIEKLRCCSVREVEVGCGVPEAGPTLDAGSCSTKNPKNTHTYASGYQLAQRAADLVWFLV